MPQRKKKVKARVKRATVRSTMPAWAKKIPPAELAELHRQYLMAGGAQTGMGFLDWVKGAARTVWNGAKKVGKFVKDNGLVSKGLTAVGTITGQPELIAAGTAAGAVGFGRKKRRQFGGSIVRIVQA